MRRLFVVLAIIVVLVGALPLQALAARPPASAYARWEVYVKDVNGETRWRIAAYAKATERLPQTGQRYTEVGIGAVDIIDETDQGYCFGASSSPNFHVPPGNMWARLRVETGPSDEGGDCYRVGLSVDITWFGDVRWGNPRNATARGTITGFWGDAPFELTRANTTEAWIGQGEIDWALLP